MIAVRRLACTVGEFELGPVSFEAPLGSYLAWVGPSGHGKTTLLWALAGVLPAQGEVRLGERACSALPPEARPLALVPQAGLVFPHLTVAENIAYGLRGAERPRVRDLARAWGCESLLSRRASGLSGGEAMRVAIARALARDPQLLLLDEPLSSLDEESRLALRPRLKSLAGGRTVLHVTHDLDEAAALATHLGVLRAGRVAAFGPTREVFLRPPDPEVAAFLGVENLVAGAFEPRSADASVFRAGALSLEVLGRYQGEGLVSISEAAVIVSLTPPREISARNVIPCAVRDLLFDRRGVRVVLEGPGGARLIARMERESAEGLELAPGKAATAVIKAAQVRALGGG